jgi:hypothetical protein
MPNVRLLHFKTKEELAQSITPLFASQGEVIPWVWFDTATYTSATTTQLDFFQTVPTDRTTGNMQAAGQIPAPMYFDVYHLSTYLNIAPTALAIAATLTPLTGALQDCHNLVIGAVTFQIAQNLYVSGRRRGQPIRGCLWYLDCPTRAGGAVRPKRRARPTRQE